MNSTDSINDMKQCKPSLYLSDDTSTEVVDSILL